MAKYKSQSVDSALVEATLQSLNALAEKINAIDATADQTTDGKMGLDKSNYPTCIYWLNFVKNNPDVFPARFDLEDFDIKLDSIQKVETILTEMGNHYAVLKSFRDKLALDVRYYTSRAINITTTEAEKDAILNGKIKSAPSLKADAKKPKNKEKANQNKTDDSAKPDQ